MELCVLGSSSCGNSYILQNSNTALIIDSGIRPKEALKQLGHNSCKIVGLILSHSHGDHSKYIREYLKLGINCYAHSDTWADIKIKNNFAKYLDEYEKNQESIMLGEFLIMPFKLIHDVTCLGFQITHPETGNIIFMTDTEYSPYLFSNISYWMIECNYSEKQIVENAIYNKIDSGLMKRITENHMSYEYLINFFFQSDLSLANKIILLHLSDNNSLADEFKQGIIETFGKDTYIAEKGLKLNLINELFA